MGILLYLLASLGYLLYHSYIDSESNRAVHIYMITFISIYFYFNFKELSKNIYYLLIISGELIYYAESAYYGSQSFISLLMINIWMIIIALIYLFFNWEEVSQKILHYF